MSTHESIITLFEQYVSENDKFNEKNNKAAGTRARKALMEITKLCKDRRKEIQEAKNTG
jgi:hypothetical protein